jgi:hypothetical protein
LQERLLLISWLLPEEVVGPVQTMVLVVVVVLAVCAQVLVQLAVALLWNPL